MMSLAASAGRHRGRRESFDVTVSTDGHDTVFGRCARNETAFEMLSLETLCLRSLESSLGTGQATFDLQHLPLGLAEKIYEFISSKGSRMAHMEIMRALAPVLRQHVDTLDFSKTKALGDSALLELAKGCHSALTQLDLSGCCFVTNAGLHAALLQCPGLRDLTLTGCRGVSDQMVVHLPYRCPSLTTLNLAGLQGLTESGVHWISFLSTLEKLCLAKCDLGDAAVAHLAAGPCRFTLKWLDLTGTLVKGASTTSLRTLQQLEYLALSSTDSGMSVTAVAALARDLLLPVALPEAPKTRAKSNRALLLGSKWSERQLLYVPKRGAAARAPARSSPKGLCFEGNGRRKAMRLVGAAGRVSSSPSCSDDSVTVGIKEGRAKDGGRELLVKLVRGIVKLWPAVSYR